MTIEKTFKLTIKDQSFFLSEEELSKLYEQCRMVLNIKDLPTTPTIPYPYDTYPWYTPKYPNYTGYPYWTTPTTTANPVENNCVMDTYWNTNTNINQKSTTGINFLSDNDIAAINDNKKWSSSVAEAISKLTAKKDNTTTTSEGIKVG